MGLSSKSDDKSSDSESEDEGEHQRRHVKRKLCMKKKSMSAIEAGKVESFKKQGVSSSHQEVCNKNILYTPSNFGDKAS